MAVLLEFGVSNDHFALGELIARHDVGTAELERIVPTDDTVIPYVWVSGSSESLAALNSTFESSPAIHSVSVLDTLAISDTTDEEHLFRISWDLEELGIIRAIIEADGAILEGECVNHSWELRIRFADHEDVARFYQHLTDQGISTFTIISILELTNRSDRGGANTLTAEQREALTLAANRGYFEIPRAVTLEEIGGELGITQQAVSNRLRRAVKRVIHSQLNILEREPE